MMREIRKVTVEKDGVEGSEDPSCKNSKRKEKTWNERAAKPIDLAGKWDQRSIPLETEHFRNT